MEEQEAALRRTLARWAAVAAVVVTLLAVWRVFLLVCPTRRWSVLRWTFEAATARHWDQPAIAALVAENALENGGPVGGAVGRELYRRVLTPAADNPFPFPPPAYAAVHLDVQWLGTESVTWSVEPYRGAARMVKVWVDARFAYTVTYGRGCTQRVPTAALVERDYVTVPTPSGWRVAYIYSPHAGDALYLPPAEAGGTAAALLAGCTG